MKQHFYIGALELVYNTGWELPLLQFDSRFLKPSLPTKSQIPVQMDWVDALDSPPDEADKLEEQLIWHFEGEERRLYLRGKYEPFLSSRLSPDRERVTVLALRRYEQEIWKEFRPWFNVHLERLLLWNRALVLHSASILYRGGAILFTAPSGTGKTTQTDLWHEHREGVTDLNGDRTVLQQTEHGWYGCGFPIYGGSMRCVQAAAPLRAVVVVRQAKEDRIHPLSMGEKVSLLYSECTVMRAYSEDVEAAWSLLEQLAAAVDIVELECTMRPSAVDVLHRYLYGA